MKGYRLTFIMHWLWAITFALMAITGLTLLGPKYGWITNYNMGVADYLHRTLAVFFTFLTLSEVMLEIRRIIKKDDAMDHWLVIGKKGFGLLNLIVANVLIITGVLVWICAEYDHAITALAVTMHESATFIMIFFVVWHIYEKSHILILGKSGGGRK